MSMRSPMVGVLLVLAASTPAAAQSCNVIGTAILCNGFSANTMQQRPFAFPSTSDLIGTPGIAATNQAQAGYNAALEQGRRTAAYNALYRYCGALAYYGPRCLSMVRQYQGTGRP